MRRFARRLLRIIARDRRKTDAVDHETRADPLVRLKTRIPDFLDRIQNKRILDFGCGTGRQTVAMAECGACHVVGLDTNPRVLPVARERAVKSEARSRIEFLQQLDSESATKFDVIVSQNSMEHFYNPQDVVATMTAHLTATGEILLTFGPTWLSPYGAHLWHLFPIPWVHLIFPENVIMAVRSEFHDDGATRYEEVEGGLNKMTVRKFETIVSRSRLEPSYVRYHCVKNMRWLQYVPGVREFFVNAITCVLTQPEIASS